MILMKEYVLSFEEKITQPWFTYCQQILSLKYNYFKTNPLIIYFWPFQYMYIDI